MIYNLNTYNIVSTEFALLILVEQNICTYSITLKEVLTLKINIRMSLELRKRLEI